MSFAERFSWLLVAGGALVSASCGQVDYFSRVYDVCNYPVQGLGQFAGSTEEAWSKSTLTDDCRKALELIVPFDPSWDQAPKGFKDKVLEAFQALVAYPLAIPAKNRLMGVAPEPAGAIPMGTVGIFHEYPNPNQSVFNYILNQVDVLLFDPAKDSSHDAMYVPGIGPGLENVTNWRQLTVYGSFWDPAGHEIYRILNPFQSISTLLHEIRHGDGFLHVTCTGTIDVEEGKTLNGFNCDNELQGPYGTQVTYLHYLLQGSGKCTGESCSPLLPKESIHFVGSQMVGILRGRINDIFPALKEILKTTDQDKVTREWILDHEGLATPASAF